MAGQNIALKENQPLFNEGDEADGMFVIRKGELVVYLEKDGNEVKLAKVGSGGMIGEMAFFDKKPRSASVKASTPCEVTKITSDDFSKLMKQIPKWFVGLMGALSTRLRETNERLQKMENKAAGMLSPYENLIKALHVITLIWHKDGVKNDKHWTLSRATAESEIVNIFGVDANWIKDLFNALVEQNILLNALDNYKNPMVAAPTKSGLTNLASFIEGFIKKYPELTSYPEPAMEMLQIIHKLSSASSYEAANITFEEVCQAATEAGLDPSSWEEYIKLFVGKDLGAISVVKVSDGQGFKVDKKEFPTFLRNNSTLIAFEKAGLK